jgi:hypothetical protein
MQSLNAPSPAAAYLQSMFGRQGRGGPASAHRASPPPYPSPRTPTRTDSDAFSGRQRDHPPALLLHARRADRCPRIQGVRESQ